MNGITDNHIQLVELAKEWINEGDNECGVELLKIGVINRCGGCPILE